MAPERNENEGEDVVDNGVLATTDGTETTGIGIVEGVTAQVEVALPATFDDDDFDDDDVVQGEDVTLIEIAPVREVPDAPEQSPLAAEEPAPAASASVASASAASVSAASVPAAAAKPAAVPAEPATPTDLDHHERVRPRTSEITLQSRRLGDFEVDRESSDLLTADRLLDPAHVVSPEPEGAWRHLVYTLSGRRINLGDSRHARARKQLDSRIAAPLTGGAKFVPVLSRKGGVGKTTVTTLLGMALADAREDRIIAVDANPDRGTLAERIGRPSGKTVRALVRARADVHGFNDISQIVARDHTRLDVLASDSDPHVSEAFSDTDYRDVADVAAHFYSVVLTDTGTGIVHSVMQATLEHADELVIVAGLSVDEARLASETLTWLESNGYAERVRSAIVVLNTARPGAALVRADELDAHFRSRVRAVVRLPYDPHIASGSAISFRDLQPETREAARELAAVVVEGLRASSVAA
ncbi:MinD/ParA family ATP-binding protein [Microbacterium paulum]